MIEVSMTEIRCFARRNGLPANAVARMLTSEGDKDLAVIDFMEKVDEVREACNKLWGLYEMPEWYEQHIYDELGVSGKEVILALDDAGYDVWTIRDMSLKQLINAYETTVNPELHTDEIFYEGGFDDIPEVPDDIEDFFGTDIDEVPEFVEDGFDDAFLDDDLAEYEEFEVLEEEAESGFDEADCY